MHRPARRNRVDELSGHRSLGRHALHVHERGFAGDRDGLRDGPEAGLGENANRRRVRDEVGPVLPGPRAGQAPVGEPVQRTGDGIGRLPKDLQKLDAVHTTEP